MKSSLARSDFARVQARIADAANFRFQQEINLRDDEIQRLREYRAQLQAEIDTHQDTKASYNKTIQEELNAIKKQIFKANNERNVTLTKMKAIHAQRLKDIDKEFQTLEVMTQKKDLKKMIPKVDRVENMIDQLKITARKSRKVRDNELIDKDVIIQLKQYKKQIKNLQIQETNLEKQLYQKQNEPEPELSETSSISESSESIQESSIEPIQMSVNYPKLIKQLEEKSKVKIRKLQNKISSANEMQEMICQKINNAKQKNDEMNQTKKILNGNKKSKKEKARKEKEIREYFSSLTQIQKQLVYEKLIEDNKSLKREIYRLDNMIYGKAGKYHHWKNIR